MNSLKNPEEYKKVFGDYDAILNFTKNLCKVYHTQDVYPAILGPVLGLPNFEYAANIKSKDELLGRIKALAQILGVKTIEYQGENGVRVRMEL